MKTVFSNGKRTGVQAVRRALKLLEVLAVAQGAAALADLSQRARLNKSTTYQLLATLKSSGFVEKDEESRRYRLGLKVLQIARSFLDNSNLIFRSEPQLREIRDRTGETATLYLLYGDHRVTVARVESPHAIRRCVSVGEAAPLSKGAGGKVILAFLSGSQVRSILARAHRSSGPAKGAKAALAKDLAKIRAQGFAWTFGEHVPGAFGVAVPLFDGSARIIGSLALSGPIERLTPTLERKAVEILRRAASRLSPVGHETALSSLAASRKFIGSLTNSDVYRVSNNQQQG